MNVVVLSIGPVFKEYVHGGSQRILREVTTFLGSLNHQVTILCPCRPDNNQTFLLTKNVLVSPTLRLKATYPEPYYTAPYFISDLIRQIRSHLEKADVFYIHDGELPFDFIYEDIPTVISFRDFVYPDTLVGGFGFKRDVLILSCSYLAQCVIDAFASFRPGITERIKIIKNGIDLDHFIKKTPDKKLFEYIKLPPNSIPILYPHRPDQRKGIIKAIEIIAKAKKYIRDVEGSLKLLIPIWVDSKISKNSNHEYQIIYDQVKFIAKENGLENSIIIHPWIPYGLMPDYYNIGKLSLCVGNFVEAFGNVPLESMACGTPCLVAKVGAHSYNLREGIVLSAPYGDTDAMAWMLIEAINKDYDHKTAIEYLNEHYSFNKMLNEYEAVITSTRIMPPLNESYSLKLSNNDRIKIPAWIRFNDNGYYNDYLYDYIDNDLQLVILKSGMLPCSVSDLLNYGITKEQLYFAYQNGIITKEIGSSLL